MNTPKWIPKHSDEVLKLFEDTRCLIRDLRVLGKKFSTDINPVLPDYYVNILKSAKYKLSILYEANEIFRN